MKGADGSLVVAVGEVTVCLTRDELDRLLETLAGFAQRDADAVLEEIRALRLAGGPICLLPSKAELASLNAALAGIVGEPLRPETVSFVTADVDEAAASGGGRR